jgi:hypothetical protein
MLDSHPDIANPGEVDFIFDYIRCLDGKWTCDVSELRLDRTFKTYDLEIPHGADAKELVLSFVKQLRERSLKHFTLNIHGNLDKVFAIFPDAKIIHIIRDPRDVARSCIGMGWAGNVYYGVDQWIETETNWDHFRSKFDPNKVIELFYEDLILNPEKQLTKVCKFIGVPFSSKMLDYPRYTTYHAPDPSAVKQWKKTLSARQVVLVETKTKFLLSTRNYELSGQRLEPPHLLERLYLVCQDKLFKWRFSFHRYGYYNTIMEKVTRKFIPSRHHVFVERINEAANQYLK